MNLHLKNIHTKLSVVNRVEELMVWGGTDMQEEAGGQVRLHERREVVSEACSVCPTACEKKNASSSEVAGLGQGTPALDSLSSTNNNNNQSINHSINRL